MMNLRRLLARTVEESYPTAAERALAAFGAELAVCSSATIVDAGAASPPAPVVTVSTPSESAASESR